MTLSENLEQLVGTTNICATDTLFQLHSNGFLVSQPIDKRQIRLVHHGRWPREIDVEPLSTTYERCEESEAVQRNFVDLMLTRI